MPVGGPIKDFDAAKEANIREGYGKAIRLFTRDEGWALQDAMVRGMSTQEFQERLHASWQANAGDERKQELERKRVCMEVQGPVLEKFGFEANFRGLMECYLAFGEDLKTDTQLCVQNTHLNWLAYPMIQAEQHKSLDTGEIRLVRWHQSGEEEVLAQWNVDSADDVRGLKLRIARDADSQGLGVPDYVQCLIHEREPGQWRELRDSELLSAVAPLGRCTTVVLHNRRAEVAEWLRRLFAEEDKKRKLQVIAEVPDELLEDLEFVLPAVQQSGKSLVYASDELQANKDVVLAAVQQEGAALQHASQGLKADFEVAIAALENDPWALQYVAAPLRGQKEVAMAAVREDGWVLKMVPEELQTDREVVTAAVLQSWEVLEIACEERRADRSVVLAAVRVEGCALNFAAPELQADRGVVLAAVRTNGEAVKFAAFELQEDPEIARAAVAQNWRAIGLLSSKVQDLEMVLGAAKQDLRALQSAEPALKAKVMEILGVKATAAAPPPQFHRAGATAPPSRSSRRATRLQRHYATLGLDERATPEAVRKRYRQLALEHHPDKHPEDPEGAKRRFQLINSAYAAVKEHLGP